MPRLGDADRTGPGDQAASLGSSSSVGAPARRAAYARRRRTRRHRSSVMRTTAPSAGTSTIPAHPSRPSPKSRMTSATTSTCTATTGRRHTSQRSQVSCDSTSSPCRRLASRTAEACRLRSLSGTPCRPATRPACQSAGAGDGRPTSRKDREEGRPPRPAHAAARPRPTGQVRPEDGSMMVERDEDRTPRGPAPCSSRSQPPAQGSPGLLGTSFRSAVFSSGGPGG